FQAEPGKVYRPVFVAPREGSPGGPAGSGVTARIYEVDSETDALIRDVTRPESADADPDTAGTRGIIEKNAAKLNSKDASNPIESNPPGQVSADAGAPGPNDGGGGP